MLKGTNLAGAVEAQEREWHAESDAVRSVLKEDGLTQLVYQSCLEIRSEH